MHYPELKILNKSPSGTRRHFYIILTLPVKIVRPLTKIVFKNACFRKFFTS